MKSFRWNPVLYRRNAREEEFLQIPQGFWAPLAQLLEIPHLSGAATALLWAGLPRCFAVRGDCPGHAQDAAARLLPLALYRQAIDPAPLQRYDADTLRAHVADQLTGSSSGAVPTADRRVLLSRVLPDGTPDPALPPDSPLPVLVRADRPLPAATAAALERCAGPVVLLLTGDTPAPEGWPLVEIPPAPDSWYGEILFRLFYRTPLDSMERGEACEAARGLLERYGRVLTEQDFAMAVSYVRRRQGPDLHTNAAYFLQLIRQMPQGTLPCCPAVPDPVYFRRSQLCDTLQLSVPLLAVVGWKHCALRAPRPYPHPDAADLPEGLPDGLRIRNRMLYAPPEDLALHAPCTLLVAEDQGEREVFYGRRLYDIHTYADLAGAAAALAARRPGVRCWVLAVDCAPEDLQAEDIRRAPYAFCAEADALTLYDGAEGLRAFAGAAEGLMKRQSNRSPGKDSRL